MENPYIKPQNQHKTAVDENITLKQEREAMIQALAAKDDEIARMGEAGQRITTERDKLAGIMQDPNIDANVGGLQRQGLGQGPMDGQGPSQEIDRGPTMSPEEAVADALMNGIDANELHQMMVDGGQDPEQAGMLIGDVLMQIQDSQDARNNNNQVGQYSMGSV